MAIRTYKVTLDTKNAIAPEPVLLRQGDKTGAVVIDATLMDNGSPVSLTGLTPSFMANTADGKAVVSDTTGFSIVDASGGEFTYQVPSQLGSVDGKIQIAYFSFSDSSGAQSTFNVVFVVEKAADMTHESAKDWVSNLNNIINQYNQWVNDAHSSWEEFVSANKQIIESIDPGGTLLTEVINARTPSGANAYPSLGNRLDAGVDARSKNIKAFGVKGDGTTDDTNAIKQAISSASTGDTLFFPNGSYKISDNIQINKRINIQGIKPIYQSGNLVNGSVLRGGGGLFFVNGSSGSFVSGLGIVVATGFTNGFDVRGTLNGIIIRDCLTIAQSHGYLIESYNGLVSDTKVQNCEAYDSIHGFISKATRTTFSNCLAQNLSFYGFGVISDNLQSITSIGAAVDNKVVACRAVSVGIAFIQYRRNYFEDNATTVPCLGNQFLGCSNQDCQVGLVIGDALGDTGGGKYHTYPVSGTVVSNYTERGGQLRAMYTEGLSLSGLYLQSIGQVSKDSTHQNTGMVVSSRSGQALGNFDNLQLLDSGSSPSVAFGNLFRTNNSSPTTITSLSGGNNGQTYTIVLWDNGTTIANNSSISLLGGNVHGYGNSVTLRCQNGVFYEMQRTKFTQIGTQFAGTSSTIDPGLNNFVDVVLSDTTTAVPISINTPEARDALLTIFIRTSHGTAAQGGFNTSQFVVPNDLPTAPLGFGNGLMTVWAYLKAINKYVLVSWRMTKYA